MQGTDIYIISGTGKSKAGNNPFIANGKMIVPASALRHIQSVFSKNRHGIGAFTITADSVPALDTWGWADYWTCAEWVLWHQKVKQQYGQAVANERFIQAWGSQDSFAGPYNECKYVGDFANYFADQGVDVGWLLSHLVVAAQTLTDHGIEVVDDAGEAASDISSGLGSIIKVAKFVAPFAAVGAGVWAVDKWVYPIFPKSKSRA